MGFGAKPRLKRETSREAVLRMAGTVRGRGVSPPGLGSATGHFLRVFGSGGP